MSLCVCTLSLLQHMIDVQKLTGQISPGGCDFKVVQRFYLNNIVVNIVVTMQPHMVSAAWPYCEKVLSLETTVGGRKSQGGQALHL